MYSESDREAATDLITTIFSSVDEVKAIYLVGSNARGNADVYSDVDISMIIENESIEKVWADAEKILLKTFQPFRLFLNVYNKESFLIGLCLQNGLEIDIGFCSLQQFISKKSSRRDMNSILLYSKNGFELPQISFKISNNISELVEKRNSDLWYDFTNAFIALKRNQIFRAANEIESIRSQLIEIYAKEKGLEHKHYRHVDLFEENLKNQFLDTYSKATYNDFKNSLLKLLEIFLNILKKFGQAEQALQYQTHFESFIKDIKL